MSTTIPCSSQYVYSAGRLVLRPSFLNRASLVRVVLKTGLALAVTLLGLLAHPSAALAPHGLPNLSLGAVKAAQAEEVPPSVAVTSDRPTQSIEAPPGSPPGLKAPPVKYSTKRAAAYILAINKELPQEDADRFAQHVVDAAQEYNLSPAVLLALIKVESRFDPDARSPKGALGLTQVIPRWHLARIATLRQELATYSVYDPRLNIYLGAAVLRMFWDSTGNLQEALLRYNGSAMDSTKAYSKMVMEEAFKAKAFLLKAHS